eukprot:14390981-Ditylum_brightwellii.AAC.2
MALLSKLAAEARAEEQKMIIRWLFDFRALIVLLSKNKYIVWSTSIQVILCKRHSHAKELETIIGCLVHSFLILSYIHHLMSQIRFLFERSQNRRSIKLTLCVIKDLQLMLFFLSKARQGISMYLLAVCKPTKVYFSDLYPAGLGRYNQNGRAWRFYLLPSLQFRASINVLEHLALIITPWIDILEGSLSKGGYLLSLTNSTTSKGWTKTANYRKDGKSQVETEVRVTIARTHAKNMMDTKVKDYSQYFPGKYNWIADALSCDNKCDNATLTKNVRTSLPTQLSLFFRISPLPKEISSWLILLLQKLPVKGQIRKVHMRTKLRRGADGNSGTSPSGSAMCSVQISHKLSKLTSLETSPLLFIEDNFCDHVMIPWLKAQSVVTYHV